MWGYIKSCLHEFNFVLWGPIHYAKLQSNIAHFEERNVSSYEGTDAWENIDFIEI
jgi:hypothetical protein